MLKYQMLHNNEKIVFIMYISMQDWNVEEIKNNDLNWKSE